ncbi:DUF3110 domain-containing protein [Calothrix sp. 336/3]|uniref:DUF3110 domain-containing protein n=1 Tax=Calothrix sp. 336/3 TaxID=1337936 RepID=UPI0004E363CE|nr:DUF3110 domain-containing protein [Calothrix sp. 336/3]AKG24411.1 hypothetical protein IJ00_03270 [Calothrix sp. 336/3]
MRVFVLLFNARTANEGIHSIREGDRNKILLFESEDDATRFALLLEAQDFPTPTPEAMDSEEVKAFCEKAGYDWEIVPENNAVVMPPERNLEETDWEAEETAKSDTPADTEFSDKDLEQIRRKLEGLL